MKSLKQEVKTILSSEYPHKEIRLTEQGTGDFYIFRPDSNTLTIETARDSFVSGDVVIKLENNIDALQFLEDESEGKSGGVTFQVE